MLRRGFLSTAAAVAVAGCSSEGDTESVGTPDDGGATSSTDSRDGASETDGGETDGGSTRDDAGATESESESSGAPSVEIVDHELVVDEGEFTTDVYVAATVENTGDAASGAVELSAEWYDGNGDYLDDSSAYLQTLGAGERWAARVYYLGTGAEDVDGHELSGEFDSEPATFDPVGLELLDHGMKSGEDEVVIEGRVENASGEEVSYVEAVGKVYDADGVVLGDEYTNATDLPVDETWSFEMSWLGRDRVADAADHAVLVTDSAL